MRSEYRAWLELEGYMPHTASSRCSELVRVEDYYGELDRHFAADRLEYSTEDERHGRANPSRIPINGDLRTNLATYKSAVALYRRFREEVAGSAVPRRKRRASIFRASRVSLVKRPSRFSIGARIQFWFGARG
jgi:hypothetical protein